MSSVSITASRRIARASARKGVVAPPPLENGDRLTAREFMRRYEAMPELRNAQLIEGIVHMSFPVRVDYHGEPDGLLHIWLGTYTVEHDDLMFLPNTTLLLDDDNTPQPDAMLCSAPKKGGRVWMNDNGYLCGQPELVCEVAASTASIDMHAKLNAYRRNGVQEYLIWLVRDERIVWHKLTGNGYEEMKAKSGKLHSEVFPGLVLDVKALLRGDKKKLVAALKASR